MMYDVPMTRTQLLLEPWQLEALRSAAQREGESVSGLVRRILSRHLAPPSGRAAIRAPRLADALGIFDDPAFSGRDHDAAIYGSAEGVLANAAVASSAHQTAPAYRGSPKPRGARTRKVPRTGA